LIPYPKQKISLAIEVRDKIIIFTKFSLRK